MAPALTLPAWDYSKLIHYPSGILDRLGLHMEQRPVSQRSHALSQACDLPTHVRTPNGSPLEGVGDERIPVGNVRVTRTGCARTYRQVPECLHYLACGVLTHELSLYVAQPTYR